MSADKCPHCGADAILSPARDFLCWSRYGNHGVIQSDNCKERAAHGQPTDEPNPTGSTYARLNWWKDRADGLNNELAGMAKQALQSIAVESELMSELAATKRELEMWKNNAGTAVTVAIERIQTQRDAALARVLELEGLVVLGRTSDCVTVLVSQDLQDVPPTTLGEAMPASTWGPYKLENDGWYKLQPDQNEAMGGGN